jgi:hypothetical protein
MTKANSRVGAKGHGGKGAAQNDGPDGAEGIMVAVEQ